MGGGAKDNDWCNKESGSISSGNNNRERIIYDNDRSRSHRGYSNNRRTSDYRNEDSYSKADDEYIYERRHRASNDHRKDYRDRDRRSRSRSRSYERNYDYDGYDRYDDRDRDREWDRDWDRGRDRERGSHRDKKEVPNNTLMIRNLPLLYTDKDLSLQLNTLGFYPKDVRLMKHKDTGLSRGFAFIEFPTVEQAIQLKEMNKGLVQIEDQECTLHYSFPKDTNQQVDKNGVKFDWACSKCGINNFKRRDECFKCGAVKDETCEKKEVIQHPTNVLQLRNLSKVTTEEKVLTVMNTLTTLPIRSLRIVPDNSSTSRNNMCILELHSVYEAAQLYSVLNSMSKGLVIDEHVVSLSYGPKTNTAPASLAHTITPSAASASVAMAALAAAQWKNMDDTSSGKGKQQVKSAILGKVVVNDVEYTKYSPPDFGSFQYENTSGYYYDHSTGFYYDSNSQYFYNPQTQKYMYYDTPNQIYVTVDSTGQVAAPSNTPGSSSSTTKGDANNRANEDTSVSKHDKVKIAKKIAKDMEKWAKTLNQKKELSKPLQLPPSESMPMEATMECETPETATAVVTVPTVVVAAAVREEFPKSPIPSSSSSRSPPPNRNKDASQDPFEIIRAEEERLVDWKRLACLLCKRQFNSCELLTKHQQLSELHKTNLTVLRQSLLNEEQLQHVEMVERELGYRDRAKERRDKFGLDDNAPKVTKGQYEEPKEPIESMSAPALPISDDNIGSRMLKAMGWTEGTGLGKSNQGMSDIVNVERRRGGLGLGSTNATLTRESYKEAVRRTALQRFKEMSDG